MPLQQETLTTISLYNVLSNQVALVNNSIVHPLISLPRATLTDSTLDSETLPPVLTFYVFRSTTIPLMVRLSRMHEVLTIE